MQLYLLALNPTDSVTEGFLPAARRLGLRTTVLTDQPEAHRAAYAKAPEAPEVPDIQVERCDVRDFRTVVGRIAAGSGRPGGIFTNSDHLGVQTALAADYFGLPAKDWRAALRTKDKAEMRRRLAAAGADTVWSGELAAGEDLSARVRNPAGPGSVPGPSDGPEVKAPWDVPYPCVVKPREGVASEDVFRADGPGELVRRCREIQSRRPDAALVVEEFLPGELFTLETLGDGRTLHVMGGFHTELSPPPHFIEERLTYVPAHPQPVVDQVLAQLDALGVGFGACHTEFVVHEGRARLIEVNYRAIGDQCDLLLAELLGLPLFEYILRTHLGEPLPQRLPFGPGGAARLDYPCADRAGTLTAAPGPVEQFTDGVRLTYRPLRRTGERHPLHHTNRDFLGVVRAVGPEQEAVDRAVTGFLAAQHWDITP